MQLGEIRGRKFQFKIYCSAEDLDYHRQDVNNNGEFSAPVLSPVRPRNINFYRASPRALTEMGSHMFFVAALFYVSGCRHYGVTTVS